MSMDIKKILVGISVIILIILGVALFRTYSSLQDLEVENTKLEEDVSLLEGEKASLEEDKALLEDIKASLELEVSSLDSEVASLEEEVDSYKVKIKNLEQETTLLNSRVNQLAIEVSSLDSEVDLLQGHIELYRDTYGELYSGVMPPYVTSQFLPLKLVNNENATNPTWAELLDFLRRDTTDSHPYTSSYMCGEYARELHDNAETEGIRVAFVVIDIRGEDNQHALNAFKTTDKGLKFIDNTGWEESIEAPTIGDRNVSVVLGEEYRSWFLFAPDWELGPWEIVESIEVYW